MRDKVIRASKNGARSASIGAPKPTVFGLMSSGYCRAAAKAYCEGYERVSKRLSAQKKLLNRARKNALSAALRAKKPRSFSELEQKYGAEGALLYQQTIIEKRTKFGLKTSFVDEGVTYSHDSSESESSYDSDESYYPDEEDFEGNEEKSNSQDLEDATTEIGFLEQRAILVLFKLKVEGRIKKDVGLSEQVGGPSLNNESQLTFPKKVHV